MRSTSSLVTGLCLVLAACGGSSSSEVPTQTTPTLSIAVPSGTMVSGTTMQAGATLGGSPASGVSWKSSDPMMVAVDANGMLTAALQGIVTITATSGTNTATAQVKVTPGAPATIRIYAGDNQTAVAGGTVQEPLCTTVHDAAGNMIVGAMVTYTVATGGGLMAAPTSPATDGAGIAISGPWTLGSTVGEQRVTASLGSLTPVTFKATAR